jgi:hypothetical protein
MMLQHWVSVLFNKRRKLTVNVSIVLDDVGCQMGKLEMVHLYLESQS